MGIFTTCVKFLHFAAKNMDSFRDKFYLISDSSFIKPNFSFLHRFETKKLTVFTLDLFQVIFIKSKSKSQKLSHETFSCYLHRIRSNFYLNCEKINFLFAKHGVMQYPVKIS